jgi:zinc transport system permease protein
MEWLDTAITAISRWFPAGSFYSYDFNVYATVGILLTCLICGAIGVIVVGNRMAFFSDALAHCAFAGVSFGLILGALADFPDASVESFVTLIMITFGILVGVGIAHVRERTGLASDTVIGVFFAFAVGLGAVLTNVFSRRFRFFNIESFSFGSPLAPPPTDIFFLAILLCVTVGFILYFYNDLVLASVHPSLAKSRGVRVRLLRYLLVILLGMIVNLCLRIVGVLLINGLLIVPAAAASNLSRNLRQTFWWTLALTVLAGLGGQWCSWEINAAARSNVGLGGAIVVLACLFFFASMLLRPILRGSGRSA